MLSAIWYHLCNLKNLKNTQGGVFILVLKYTFSWAAFPQFLNCTIGTKSVKASHLKEWDDKIYKDYKEHGLGTK